MWLQAICDGVCVPADRKAAGWDRFLKDLGLVMTDKPVQAKKKDPKTPGDSQLFPHCFPVLFFFLSVLFPLPSASLLALLFSLC